MALTYNKATRDLSIKGTITFNNGEQVHLTDSEILHYSIDQQLGNEGLPLGSAEAASFNLEISNVGRRFTPEQFDNAEVHMFVGIKTGGEYAYSDFGVWYVDSTSSPEQSVSVSLSGYDALATRFSAVFTDEKSLYPSTIGTLAQTVCLAAGIALKSTAFPNAAVKISKMPTWEEETTLRDILSYCAICAGGYVRIARNGMVEIVCFADGETHRLNPGIYQTYTPSGGTAFAFNCIEAMLTKDGEKYSRFAVDDKIASNATNTIQVEYNPLLTKAIIQSVVAELAGITMSAGDVSWGGDPSVMCTDYYIVTSLDGSEHKLMVTSQSYSFDGGLSANESCSLPTINTQSSAAYSTSTNMYDANGNLKATRISGLDKKVITATVGHFEQLTAETIETDSLVTAYLSAIELLAKSIKATDIETNTLTAAAAEIIKATIRKINACVITTDELYAAFADIFALKLNSLTAKDIETDSLAAAFASFAVITAGNATFDKATVTNLVAEAMSLEFGIADQVFIKNLAVEYAQMVGAAIGDLCIKASDGNYYLIDVKPDGTVTATPATVTDGEINAGQTESGKVILETDITAENLNAGNLLATYALVNQIDAARIDVDQLFAREAFVNLLRTTKIIGDKSIEMIAETAENARQEAEEAAIYEGMLPPPAPIPEGKLWLDRSTTPPVLKRWLGDGDVPVDGTFTRTDVGNPVQTVGNVQRFDSIITAFKPVQEGSGEPSPENVRPLTGWDALNLNHARKNLFLMPEEKTLNGVTLSKQGDVWVLNGTATGSVNFASAPITLASGEYTLCANNPAHLGYGQAIVQIYSATTGDSAYASNNKVNSSITKTITGASDYVCRIRVQSGFTYDNFVIQPQLELGAVATAYDAYQHELYIAKLGQTVYGGRYSWLTGMLTAEWYIEELQNADDWYYHAENDYMRHTLDHIVESMEFDDIVCSHYTCGTDHARIVISGGVARVLRIYRTGFTDVESWVAFLDAQKAAGTPVQFAYKLAEPIEIQLDPQLIAPFDATNLFYGDGEISITYTGTGWETVNDVDTLRNAQDILIAQQDALRREVDTLNSYTRLDNDGLWVGKQGETGQTLLKYDSVNIVVNGKIVTTYAAKYQEMGGMRIFVPNAGGLAFAPAGN